MTKMIQLSGVPEDVHRALEMRAAAIRFEHEHREAIEAHNKFIDENGIWSERFRPW